MKKSYLFNPSPYRCIQIFSPPISIWGFFLFFLLPFVVYAHPAKEMQVASEEGVILDDYEVIRNFYAYDPSVESWVPLYSFTIIKACQGLKPLDSAVDYTPYRNFWAYDTKDQKWHKVSLVKYLQQALPLGEDAHLPTQESEQLSEGKKVGKNAPEGLLEELMGKASAAPARHNAPSTRTIWSNFSCYVSTGAGITFYENKLVNVDLFKKKAHDYILITDTKDVYKPHWFYHELEKVDDFNMDHFYYGPSHSTQFTGKGLAIPITIEAQYTFCKGFLVGGGREMVFNYVDKLMHDHPSIKSKEWFIPHKWFVQGRWFVKGGWYFFRNEKHRFFTDLRLFYGQHLGNRFRRVIAFGFGPYLHKFLAYNWGIGYEQQIYDCVSFFSRFSIEMQSFKQFLPTKPYTILYKQHGLYVQCGVALQLPSSYDTTKYPKPEQINPPTYPDGELHPPNVTKEKGLLELY